MTEEEAGKEFEHTVILCYKCQLRTSNVFLLGNSIAKLKQPAWENLSMNSLTSGTTKEQASEGTILNFCLNSVGEFDADTEAEQ